jgi:hypothetical protein
LANLPAPDEASVVTADARDLSKHVRGPFDAVLAMGPFYHLVSVDEQSSLMAAMREVLAPEGLVISTHLTRIGLISYMLTRFPTWAMDSPEEVDQVLSLGYLPDHPRNGNFRGYWTTPEEIRQLHERHGLEVVALHSQDPCIGSADEIFNRLPSDYQACWAEVLLRVSDDPLALGSGRSVLCVARLSASASQGPHPDAGAVNNERGVR